MLTNYLTIKGKVQGVFFRATAKDVAKQLNIKGWIRNNSTGDVECLITGSESSIEQFIRWCKQGPSNAEVKEVIVEEKDEILFDKFSIVH